MAPNTPWKLNTEFASMTCCMVSETTWTSNPREITRNIWLLLWDQPPVPFIRYICLVSSAVLWLSSDSTKKSFQIRLRSTFISVTFKSHTDWINAQRFRSPYTMIHPNTAGTSGGLNYFNHVIYPPETITDANIAIHSSKII